MSGFISNSTGADVDTLAGDVTGTTASNKVISITGASGAVNVAATGNVLTWAVATTAPGIKQDNAASASGQNLSVTAQAGNGSGNSGGNLLLNGGVSGGGSGTAGQVQVSSQFVLKSNILNDGYFAANTQDATSNVVIYTDTAIPSGSIYDFIVTVVAVSPGTVNVYRADYSFTYLNNGGSMVAIGAAPIALNVRTNGTGSTFATAINASTTTVKVTATGLAATSINWAVSFNRVRIN